MFQSRTVETVNARSDGELCRNACGFYGNKIWDGFCSKCYREVYQKAKQIQESYDGKINLSTNESSRPTSPSVSNSQDKRRSNITMPSPIRQMVNRAASSNSVISALLSDEQTSENETASKYLEMMTTDDIRTDIKSQVKTFSNHFHKKCTNKNVTIDTLIQEYGTFKETIKKRIQTHPIYKEEDEDLIHQIINYVESITFSKDYSLIFDRIATAYEEHDLSIQNRISSLHWVTPTMLDTVLNENISVVQETIYKAANALIELDSKTTPQGKIDSIMECKTFIEQALQSSSEMTINADCFLPALIYVVLKAKPPRLHSNIQFLSNFSQPNGEQLYYLANLDSAVRFIELVEAEHLGLSTNDFSSYMRGEPVLPSKFVSLFDYPLENNLNIEQLRQIYIQYNDIKLNSEKFNENIVRFNQLLTQTITDINELLHSSFAHVPFTEQIPELNRLENEDITINNNSHQSNTETKHLLDESRSGITMQQNIE